MTSRCYKCGAYQDVECCNTCHKIMCPKCSANKVQRTMDAIYENIFGYSADWYPEGKC